jgi:uracil-DNA glycosylase
MAARHAALTVGVMDDFALHPVTGGLFESPVPPGTGWPGDPATSATPVAATAVDVRRLSGSAEGVEELEARVSVCRACPRLVSWRESVARTGRRASFADQPYWGRPGPSFGDPDAQVLIVGLAPAANGTNRTGRMFTGDSSGDFLYAALHRTGWASQPTSVAAGDGQTLSGIRIVAAVRCAPPQNKPTAAERATCSQWLQRDLELASPHLRAVLSLGALAWDAVLAAALSINWQVPRPKPRFHHAGQTVLTTADGRPIPLVGSYHVSPHNTFTGRLTAAMLDEVLLALRGDVPDQT